MDVHYINIHQRKLYDSGTHTVSGWTATEPSENSSPIMQHAHFDQGPDVSLVLQTGFQLR